MAKRTKNDPKGAEISKGVILKNEIVDAVGFGHLSDSDVSAFAGIAGDRNDARIYHDLEVFGRFAATLVLCDEALGLVYNDENDDFHGFQVSNIPRFVRELIARELVEWDTRHPGVEISDYALDRLGFESVF